MSFFGADWSFFNPVALWGLATLAIPVLIHLFNRSKGRLVRIGHINLIRDARKLKVTELKLAQWWLLLIRIILFTLACLILAGLARPDLQAVKKNTAFVSPAWLASAGLQQIADLQQLFSNQETSRLVLLEEGLPELEPEQLELLSKDRFSADAVNNIWPLLTDSLSNSQYSGDVDVYAVDLLQQFGSDRPALNTAIEWNLSHPSLSDNFEPVMLKLVLAHDKDHKKDADIIRAALISLKQHRLPGLSWDVLDTENLQLSQIQADWLIVLSDKPLDEFQSEQLASPVTILTDAVTGPEADNKTSGPASWTGQMSLPFYPFSHFSVNRTGKPATHMNSILTTPTGFPLIQTGQLGSARLIQFNSRFLPGWSSIAEQLEFPELLLQLLQSNQQEQQTFAGARVLSSQLQAVDSNSSPLPTMRRTEQALLAALMILLWLLERWLSERRRRE